MIDPTRTAAAALALALLQHPAHADGFDVRPITVETRDGTGLVVVTNPGERRIYLESQVLDWSQNAAGQEQTPESSTALASPPAMWVPPHSSYTMRFRLPGSTGERAYRIVIRQLPERSDLAGGHVVFALTQNLPAFTIPADPAPPALSARLDGPRRLLLGNAGGRRVRVTRLSQDGRILAAGLLGYALAHGTLNITTAAALHAGAVEVETDLGPQTINAR